MPKPKYHILVCTNSRPPGHPRGSCGEKGAQDVLMKFFAEMETRGLFGEAIVTGTTCVGPCQMGTTVIVYPDAVWYGNVTPAQVPMIMEQHIQKGKPVEALIMPETAWG